MTNPRLALFSDVAPILDAALASGGGSYTLSTHGKAVRWRQRAYEFRKLYASTVGHSKYDCLTLSRVDETSTEVIIRVREIEGTFKPASIPVPPPLIDDDLTVFAQQLAKDLGV